MIKKEDKIFNSPLKQIVDFKFDEKVANVFEDMINRSIPGYGSVISFIGLLAAKNYVPNTNIYDLGSSLGAASLAIRNKINSENCKIFAVDNSKTMINRSRKFFEMDLNQTPVKLICDDIRNVEIINASVVILNYTLQFIPVEDRNNLINKISKGLVKGGILILSEKVTFEDSELDSRMIDRYYDFKRQNGYSELEISQKREALENVLIPETIAKHKSRLYNAGFSSVDIFHQCFNFISFIAKI